MKNHRTGDQILNTVWDALLGYRENCISTDDELWDEICLSMKYIEFAMGYERDGSGNLVYDGNIDSYDLDEWEYNYE